MVEGTVHVEALRLEVAVIHSSIFGMNEVKSVRSGCKIRYIDNLALLRPWLKNLREAFPDHHI